jgi:hypothetical protein
MVQTNNRKYLLWFVGLWSLCGSWGLNVLHAQSQTSTYRDLILANDEIQFMKVWEKLSENEQNKFQSLYLFRGLQKEDFDFGGFKEKIETWLNTEGPAGEIVLEQKLSPEKQSVWIWVNRSDCLKVGSLFDGRVWAQQGSTQLVSARTRTWKDEVKEFVCAQDWEIFRNTICAPIEEKKYLTEKPVIQKKTEVIAAPKCVRSWNLGVSFAGSKDRTDRLWVSQFDDSVDWNQEFEKIQSRIERKLKYFRIQKDQKTSGLKDSDYFVILENPPTGKFKKLSLYLYSEKVSSRDLENPCPKLERFFARHKETPSEAFLLRCGEGAKQVATKKSYKLTPMYAPDRDADYEVVLGYHAELVRIANYVLRISDFKSKLGSDSQAEDAKFVRFESLIEKGLYSRLMGKITSVVLGQRSDADIDTEAEIAKIVIAFVEQGDGLKIQKEKEALKELTWFLEYLKSQCKLAKGENSEKALFMIQKQLDLAEKVFREVQRRSN